MIKKIFKGLLIFLGILVVGFLILKWSFSEELPQGTKGAKEKYLTDQMLKAIKFSKVKEMDSITWTFRGVNKYSWRTLDGSVVVKWDENKVVLFPEDPSASFVYKKGVRTVGKDAQGTIDYALSNFNNDSFWLMAPFKILDKGTEREWISDRELLVRYTSGGTTPGDAYLWQLDENYVPVSFKMWTQIIPLDGVKAHWNDWYETSAGFMLPRSRDVYGIEIPLTDVVVYD